jgi:hypothetical protein
MGLAGSGRWVRSLTSRHVAQTEGGDTTGLTSVQKRVNQPQNREPLWLRVVTGEMVDPSHSARRVPRLRHRVALFV